jgi:hypothetical protein
MQHAPKQQRISQPADQRLVCLMVEECSWTLAWHLKRMRVHSHHSIFRANLSTHGDESHDLMTAPTDAAARMHFSASTRALFTPACLINAAVLATGGGTALSIVPKVGLHTSAGVRTLRPLRALAFPPHRTLSGHGGRTVAGALRQRSRHPASSTPTG